MTDTSNRKTSSMISLTKTYRTRDGREVHLYEIIGDMIFGRVLSKNEDEGWVAAKWKLDGRNAGVSCYDLIETKPRIKRTGWVNVYSANHKSLQVFATKKDADLMAAAVHGQSDWCRLACVQITIDCEEGEGL